MEGEELHYVLKILEYDFKEKTSRGCCFRVF